MLSCLGPFARCARCLAKGPGFGVLLTGGFALSVSVSSHEIFCPCIMFIFAVPHTTNLLVALLGDIVSKEKNSATMPRPLQVSQCLDFIIPSSTLKLLEAASQKKVWLSERPSPTFCCSTKQIASRFVTAGYICWLNSPSVSHPDSCITEMLYRASANLAQKITAGISARRLCATAGVESL